MISIRFSLTNPWSDRWKPIYAKSKCIGLNKAFEFNVYKTHDIVEFDLTVTANCDHAGINVLLGLLGYTVEMHWYDTRHWDYENQTWESK